MEFFIPRETITPLMLKGTTIWWQKDKVWKFHSADCRDVYDRIFKPNTTISLLRIYDHKLTHVEKQEIFLKERELFQEAKQ